MIVYRIAKSKKRSADISGMGAFITGGRWNSPGTYALYTSENSSLAYLENLVHFEPENTPPALYIIQIEIKASKELIHLLPEHQYPKNWQEIGNIDNKKLGDLFMSQQQFLALKVRSAVNKQEYNLLLNPLFPGYHDLVKIKKTESLDVDDRLIR